MQLTAVATPRGTVVFDTQPVPAASDVHELLPLRALQNPIPSASQPSGNSPNRVIRVPDCSVQFPGRRTHAGMLAAQFCLQCRWS